MRTVNVRTAKPYNVYIGAGLLDRAGAYVRNAAGGGAAAVVTDDIVAGIYLDRLLNSLQNHGYDTPVFTVKNGEASKNTFTYVRLLEFLADKRLSRTDVVVALGGGVVGDLAGFAAATYMRGIAYIQIPTTLLAAIDSSVGGKTGIDLDAGKNLAGAFHQPAAVLCDHALLEMLPPRIFTDGCAEAIKLAMIADGDLFGIMSCFPILDLEDVVTRCVTIKRDVVSADEYETGLRKLLNFGHTVGHAIELLSNYSVSHGKAVAIGMAVETRAAVKMGFCTSECYDQLVELLHKYGLPYQTRLSAEEISGAALNDKKRSGGKITLVVPEAIGTGVLHEVDVGDLGSIIALGTAKSGG